MVREKIMYKSWLCFSFAHGVMFNLCIRASFIIFLNGTIQWVYFMGLLEGLLRCLVNVLINHRTGHIESAQYILAGSRRYHG